MDHFPAAPAPSRPRAALLLGTAVITALIGLSGPPTSADAAQAATKPSATTAFRTQVVKSTVTERTSRHRSTLTRQKCLDTLAQAQASRMAKKQTLYHQPLGPVLDRCGLREVGENVAYGFPSAKATVAGWMRSPGHRANILHSSYRRIGVGAVKDSHGRWWVCELFGRTA